MLKNLSTPTKNSNMYKKFKSEYKKLPDEKVLSMYEELKEKEGIKEVKYYFENSLERILKRGRINVQ